MDAQNLLREARRLARRSRARWQAQRARRVIRPGMPLAPAWPLDPAGAERLVSSPVFLLSSIRSGSTLLRVVLNSHSQVCAPHELHLRKIEVRLSNDNAKAGMAEAGLSERDLENLLWDRVLHLELQRAGKRVVVDKTPQNVLEWERLLLVWPQARYLLLLRHPVHVYHSIRSAWPQDDANRHLEIVNLYAVALSEARAALPALVLRYEDFVAEPERHSQEICAYLGLPWEPDMLRYATGMQGNFRGRLGDWSATLRSGVIRPPQPPPDSIPAELSEACRLLGYS